MKLHHKIKKCSEEDQQGRHTLQGMHNNLVEDHLQHVRVVEEALGEVRRVGEVTAGDLVSSTQQLNEAIQHLSTRQQEHSADRLAAEDKLREEAAVATRALKADVAAEAEARLNGHTEVLVSVGELSWQLDAQHTDSVEAWELLEVRLSLDAMLGKVEQMAAQNSIENTATQLQELADKLSNRLSQVTRLTHS